MFILKLELEKDGQEDHLFLDPIPMDRSVVTSVQPPIQMSSGVPMYFHHHLKVQSVDAKQVQVIPPIIQV